MKQLNQKSGAIRSALIVIALILLCNGINTGSAALTLAGSAMFAALFIQSLPFLIHLIQGNVTYFAVVIATDINGRHEIWSGQFPGYLAANKGLKSAIDRLDNLGSEFDLFDKQTEITSVVISKRMRASVQ